MAKVYQPAFPFTVAAELLKPSYQTAKGTPKKTFPARGERFNCSFRTFGGTERVTNDLYEIIDTATVETWYRPDLTADCRVLILETGRVYDVIGTPEDIEMRHQFMRVRVQAVEGGA